MKNKHIEILKNARSIINTPDNWTQDAVARNNINEKVSAHSSEAVCWCAMGAMYKASKNNLSEDYQKAFYFLDSEAKNTIYFTVLNFNDKTDHEAVLGLFDRAIERAIRSYL